MRGAILGEPPVELLPELSQPGKGHAVAAGEQVEAAPHGRLDGLQTLRGDPHRRMRLLDGMRVHGGLGDPVVLALVAEGLAGQRLKDDVDGFLPARPAFAQLDPQALELVSLIAAAQAHVEASAAEQIDGGDLLGDDERMMQWYHDHGGADADPPRPVRQVQSVGQRPREQAVGREVMLG